MEYKYKAVVTDVYDGDTVTATIDLGFGVFLHNQKIRLFGIDTPELRGEEIDKGKIARNHLRNRVLHENIEIQTFKDKKGKYGRWLAVLYLDGEDLNEDLYNRGLAVKVKY